MKWSELTHFSPKQKLATETADKFKYTLYGGAAYGGKSYWLRWYPIRQLVKWANETKLKGIRGALFCEDYPALKDRHLSKIQYEFPEWLGRLKDDGKEGLGFYLNQEYGSGALLLRNLDDPAKYLSSEFALAAIDELTRNKEEIFSFIRMRIRWPGITNTKFIAGTNPGSVGHAWVKKRWIDRHFDSGEQESDQFAYVKATLDDNPYADPNYEKALSSLPENLRKAYREGNWDTFEGQFFSEWDANEHTVDPFPVPHSWRKFRSIDVSGHNGITSCHWYALDYDGNVWVYREYYATDCDSDEHARHIFDLSQGEEYHYTVIDSAAFDKLGLPETIAEVYIKNGVSGLVPSSKNRIHGWEFVHEYLRWSKSRSAKIKFFTNCKEAIRTIPTLVHDNIRPEDLDSNGEDHAADELRYYLHTLRAQKTPTPLNMVQRRLLKLKQQEEEAINRGVYTNIYG